LVIQGEGIDKNATHWRLGLPFLSCFAAQGAKKNKFSVEVFRKKALCIYEGYFSQTREKEKEGLGLPDRGLFTEQA